MNVGRKHAGPSDPREVLPLGPTPKANDKSGRPARGAMRAWVWLALLLALPLAAGQPPDGQQEACRPPVLELQQPPRGFDPGSSMALLMAIENPNVAPVESVHASITTTAPAGWTAVPAQRELTLGPQNVSITALAVTAPHRGAGAGGGNITVLVLFVCARGDIQTSASASGVMPVSINAFNAPWPVVLTAFLVLAGGVTVLGLRRLRRGVAIRATGPAEREVAPAKSVKFTYVVENRRGKPQRLRIVREGVPDGWTLHLALESLELEPGEEKALWAILKAPPQTPIGLEVSATLHLEDARGVRDLGSLVLHARVAGPS